MDLEAARLRNCSAAPRGHPSTHKDIVIYPGHDYGGVPSRTLGEPAVLNPALAAGTYREFFAVP
ncbi:MAG: hypothetical protein JRN11_06150 [Nitrososphaerota archaeon]|nr:hypothetical protein [Nitrososphaerota archaeon]